MFPIENLSEILAEEDRYIEQIKRRWRISMDNPFADGTEHTLRMGKRTELLGDAQRKYIDSREKNIS